jgi:hypothetical protein
MAQQSSGSLGAIWQDLDVRDPFAQRSSYRRPQLVEQE